METRGQRKDKNGDGSGDGAGMETGGESRRQTQNGNGNGDEGGSGGGIDNGEKKGEGEEFWCPLDHKRTVEDQAQPFRTRHYLCRQEVAPAGSQQLHAQDPTPARRCGAKEQQGTRDGKEEKAMGTGTGMGTGMRTGAEMSARLGIGARMGAEREQGRG